MTTYPPLLQTLTELEAEFNEWDVFLKYLSADHQLIGSVRGRMDADKVCHIGKLIVDPHFQCRGIGKALMNEIEGYFPKCHKLVLFTSKETPHTAALYETLGYRITGIRKMNDIPMILMEKYRK